jgi:hypothetical protein
MSLRKFINSHNGNGPEGNIIKNLLASIITGLLFIAIIYFITKDSELFPKYGYYLFVAVISYGFIISSIIYIRTYKSYSCMTGMMIGMTIGMAGGFIPGMFIGATNGLFYGSLFGITVGAILGIWVGSSCGVMGFMEGIMAGFMGGLMGAMTTLMLLNDHLNLAIGIFSGIEIIILISLNYMIYMDSREREVDRNEDYFITLLISLILISLTSWMMLYGPRGGIFA